MPVTLSRSVATLTGVVSVDDAEPLSEWLRATRHPKVRLAGCTNLHTAALQALLAARPAVISPPAEPFLARWIAPLLAPPPVPTATDEEIR
ncbi:MAG TPA: hypothetical protein VHN80_21425 [Kineosporiaceae bacterium]|nr:hypothetical protein [Kineosporiaceae bacterium]